MSAEPGKMYDVDSAVAFITHRTGLSQDDASRIIAARDALQVALGIAPPDEEIDLGAIVARHPDLLRPSVLGSRRMTYELEATFIQRETGLAPSVVTTAIAADTAYMVASGIMDRGAETQYETWAKGWAAQ